MKTTIELKNKEKKSDLQASILWGGALVVVAILIIVYVYALINGSL